MAPAGIDSTAAAASAAKNGEEYGALAESPANGPRDDSNRHVSRVIEGRVSSQSTGQALRPGDPERDRCHCRSEHVSGDRHEAIRHQDRVEARCGDDGGRADGDRCERRHNDAALRPGRIVESIAAPIGVCRMRPSKPSSVVTGPTADWLQCCCVTRKTFRYGPSAPRTSASRKFTASSDAGLKADVLQGFAISAIIAPGAGRSCPPPRAAPEA
jgi:hypothetical protein